MADPQIIFERIDALVDRVHKHAVEPQFSDDVARRSSPPDFSLPDESVLRIMIKAIAYSQQAPAKRITEMDRNGVFDSIFGSYEIDSVARMNPEDLLEKYWSAGLSPIRFRSKVAKMVECAISLQKVAGRYGSYMRFLQSCQFPGQFSSINDIDAFWDSFEAARVHSPRFFRNLISLCHLLQWLGFPCAKPDKVVMNVAITLRMAPERKQHSEVECREVIKLMQAYAAQRKINVPIVDLMFLIIGAQTDATQYVSPSYYSRFG